MWTMFPVRNFAKVAATFERCNGKLTIVNLRVNSSLCNQTHGSLKYVKPKVQNPNLTVFRYMAKSRDTLKQGKGKIKIDENELSKYFELAKLTNDFAGALQNFKLLLLEQASVRTSTNAVENIKVKYDGETYVIQDLAEVGRKSGKEIILEMSAFVNAIPAVTEAVRKSPLGLNPKQEGSTIIVPIPKVTREHREAMYKGAKSLFNKCKENIRNVQNKYIKQIDGIKGVSDDDIFNVKAQLTALGNKYINEAETLLKIKEKELLST